MGRRATLQTIADAVGVSRSTVSNAYNRPDQLNPRLRARILAVAAELGYAGPDPAARRLRTGHAGAIGLLFTEALSYAFTDPGAVGFLEGLAREAEAGGTALLLIPSPPGGDAAAAVREAVVDGLCIYSMADDQPSVRAALERGLPTVVVEERPNDLPSGIDAGRALLAGRPRPTAILASTDQLALGVLQAAREVGLRVPGDVSVAGFDDVPAAG